MKTNKGSITSFMVIFLGVSILWFFACGDTVPDRIQITPSEKTMEMGEDFQFQAAAFTKDNKEISNAVFEWKIEGKAGSINNSGRFFAEKPGEVIILVKSGDATGKAKALVQKAEAMSETEVEQPSTNSTDSDLPAVIVIDNQDFEDREKGAVNLSHQKHIGEYGVTCIGCHHEYKDGKNIWTEKDPVKRCVTCHDPVVKQGDIMKLQIAYHNNCKNCHKVVVEDDKSKNAPYSKCSDCHEDLD